MKHVLRPSKEDLRHGRARGGFAAEEVTSARDRGFITVKIGQRILRTETAAITLVGILQYELGDIG